MEQNRQPNAGMENAGAAGGSNMQPLGEDSAQNDGAQLPGEKKTGAKKRESGEGDQSKSTQFRRSQAVGEFLCECKGFAASAISAIVRLSYCSEIAISQLDAIDAYCVDLFLDDKCSARVIDEASVQGHRCMRAAKSIFIGLVIPPSDATPSVGGGESADDRGWGRDPKEDEYEWARRCAQVAMRLVKPRRKSGGRNQ